jgi:hypothetical protein
MDLGDERTWLTGEKVRPWEFKARFSTIKTPRRVVYKYSIRNDEEDTTVWEREPSRVLDIMDPNNYNGELGRSGTSQWGNVGEVFLVNGFIDKADANFVGGLSFDEIKDTDIFIGPYPQLKEDTIAMSKAGVTGVLNVQTDIDISHRGVNWSKMINYYQASGITAVHYPIHDFNEEDLKLKLFKGAEVLNEMINDQGLKVYVHCTAGMGRAPAVVLTYLSLFKGWDPTDADLYVKQYRKVSVPNMRAVKTVVEQYKDKMA